MASCNCESWVRIADGRKLPDTPQNVELGLQAARSGVKVEMYSESGPWLYSSRPDDPDLICLTCNPDFLAVKEVSA